MLSRLLLLLVTLLGLGLRTRGFENLDGQLLEAAERGDAAKVEELLDRGAHVDCRNNYGVSAFIFAANNNHRAALEVLLRRGADKEAKSNDGRTALIWASVWGHEDVVGLLLDSGAEVDQSDRRGMTALMHAVFEGKETVVRRLLLRQADPLVENVYGGTALSIARLVGRQPVLDMVERAVSARIEKRYSPPFHLFYSLLFIFPGTWLSPTPSANSCRGQSTRSSRLFCGAPVDF